MQELEHSENTLSNPLLRMHVWGNDTTWVKQE